MRKFVLAGALSVAAMCAVGAQPASADRGFNQAMCIGAAFIGDPALREWCYQAEYRRHRHHWRHHRYGGPFWQDDCWRDRYGYLHCR